MSTAVSTMELGDVSETLLIPLAARALAPRLNPDLHFRDPAAEQVVARLAVDLSRFAGDRASMRGSIVRAGWFDRVAREFITSHRDALCVALGAGLDSRAARVGIEHFPSVDWIDLDLAPVVSLRRKLLDPVPHAADLIADLADPGWIDDMPWPRNRPALFVAEGVLMYLRPAEVERFVRCLAAAAQRRAAAVTLAFDYASPWMVRNSRRHPSVKKTRARFSWALRRPSDLQSLDGKLVVAEHVDITARSGLLAATLGRVHRLLTGREVYACVRYVRPAAP
ncbi:MAG: class I SAM-dependent methyltransferase [Proteobacteria bacterium]|nr:class I SAM-dependent methyltransferase [Pseudomonadota bacterium]